MKTNNIRLKAALEAVRLERLYQDFADEAIGDDILETITETDLEKLGVLKLGDRKRLLAHFQRMATCHPDKSSLVEVRGGTLSEDSELKGTIVKTFLIGRFPVMQEEWEWVRLWGISNGYDLGVGQAIGSTRPVTQVNWYDAVKWCNAKSEHENFSPVYECEGAIYRKGEFGPSGSKLILHNAAADGYRLPTEAEWEWAACGGILSQRQSTPPPDRETSLSAKLLDPFYNELGIYNMTSNVWEWCWDQEDSQGAHRIRSGIWSDTNGKGSGLARISRSPDSRLSVLGFRLARNV
ncbi:MAG: SUMF1/EgtB/PvdO family nonheme iron enzyme [Spartobacteria bacterium]